MFNYQMTYTNNRMQTFTFGYSSGLHLDTSELFNYQYAYDVSQGVLSSVTVEPGERDVSLLYLASDEDKGNINVFDAIIDYDARIGKPGTLTLNGYSIKCMFIASEPDDYWYKEGYMRRDMTLLVLSKYWERITTHTFMASGDLGTTGKGYPHDYPYDYTAQSGMTSLTNDSDFPSDFVLRMYGPCTDPYVAINGNSYGLTLTMLPGEYLEIDSRDHTQVIKHGVYGDETNVFDSLKFGAPGSGQYPFELIAPGNNSLSWPQSFRFDIDLIDGRSTPKWYEHNKAGE